MWPCAHFSYLPLDPMLGARVGTGNPRRSQELWWNGNCITHVQWLLVRICVILQRNHKQTNSTYEEEEESRTKENRPLHLEIFLSLRQYTFLVIARSIIETSATGWWLIVSVCCTPNKHLPLYSAEGRYWLWRSRCENKTRRSCYSQRGRAASPQPLTTLTEVVKELFSHSSVLRTPINHLFMLLSTDFTCHLFHKIWF